MIGEITKAILDECAALLQGTGAEIILKTNFKKMEDESYSGNFILLDVQDAPDSLMYMGGLTRMDWKFAFNSYNFQPDAYNDDTSDYSTSLMNFIDIVRQHFTAGYSNQQWFTAGMNTIFNTYGFQFTFGGVFVAEAIEKDGVTMGWGVIMESTGLDDTTLSIIESAARLQTVNQVNNPPFTPQPIPIS